MYGEWCLWFWHCLCVSVDFSFFHFTFHFGESWSMHVFQMEETNGIWMFSLRLVCKNNKETREKQPCFWKSWIEVVIWQPLYTNHCRYSGNLELNPDNEHSNFFGNLYSDIKGTAMERVRRLWETWTVLKTPRYQYSNYNVNMSAFQLILLIMDILG